MNKHKQNTLDLNNFKSIYLPLFLAGCGVMIFEVSFFRIYSFLLGATVEASAIVLSAFMFGLGIGGFISGKLKTPASAKRARMLLGITGLTFTVNYWLVKFLIGNLAGFYLQFGQMSDFMIIMLAFTAVMLPAVCVGTLLPCFAGLTENITTENEENGRIYFWETLGSAIGGLLSGFILFRFIGQNLSTVLALGIIIIAGLLVKGRKSSKTVLPFAQDYDKETAQPIFPVWQIIIFAFITGLIGTGMQVLVLRVFRVYLTNTSYAFALLSSIAVSGLFIGAWLFSRKKTLTTELAKKTIFVISLLGITLLIVVLSLSKAPSWLIIPLHENLTNNLARLYLPPVMLSIFSILPVTIFTGYCFPLATALLGENRGKAFSKVLVANSLGSVIGPLLISFVLIKSIGTQKALFLLAVLPFLLLPILRSEKKIKMSILMIMAVSYIISMFFTDSLKILPPSYSRVAKDVLFYKETPEGTIVVGQEEGSSFKTTHINNSLVIGSTYDAVKAVKMLGNIPFLYGNKVEKALVVGFGMGVTTAAIADKPDIEELTCLELATDLGEAADHYSFYNNNVINFTKLNLIAGDGRHYLQKTVAQYDLISSDPTHPILGSAALYSYEYFQLCRSRLTETGMVSQYLPLHKLRTVDLLDILKTFQAVFPHSQLWFGHTHAVLVGSMQPVNLNFIDWQRRSAMIFDKLFYANPYHLAVNIAMDDQKLAEATKDASIIHDDKSSLEFFDSDAMRAENWLYNFQFLLQNRSNPADFISGIQQMDVLERYLYANNLLANGLIYSNSGDIKKYLEALNNAMQVCPDNQEYSFLLKAERGF